jgi:hypothetical protein
MVVLLQTHLAMDKRLGPLHLIEDRLNTRSGALPVLTKCGNSILTDMYFRMRFPLIGSKFILAFSPAFTIALLSTDWAKRW